MAAAERSVTVKDRVTELATPYVVPPTVPPLWLATIVHVPAATVVMFNPETVQIPVVLEVRETVKPELAVAVDAKVSVTNLSVGSVKVIIWVVAPAAVTAIVSVAVELPPALVAVTVYVAEAETAVGVPLIRPVAELNDRPEGRDGEIVQELEVPPVFVGVSEEITTVSSPEIVVGE